MHSSHHTCRLRIMEKKYASLRMLVAVPPEVPCRPRTSIRNKFLCCALSAREGIDDDWEEINASKRNPQANKN